MVGLRAAAGGVASVVLLTDRRLLLRQPCGVAGAHRHDAHAGAEVLENGVDHARLELVEQLPLAEVKAVDVDDARAVRMPGAYATASTPPKE